MGILKHGRAISSFALSTLTLISLFALLAITAKYNLLCTSIFVAAILAVTAVGCGVVLLGIMTGAKQFRYSRKYSSHAVLREGGKVGVELDDIRNEGGDEHEAPTRNRGEDEVKRSVLGKRQCWACSVCLLVFFLLLSLGGVAVVMVVLVGQPADMNGVFTSSSSLPSGATIEMEENGLLHIRGESLYSVGYAQGVAVAKTRLFQFDVQRRLVMGTLAEVVGESGVGSDKLLRTFGFDQTSVHAEDEMSSEAREIVSGYLDGVNDYVRATPTSALPLEFRVLGYRPAEFTVVNVIAWGKYVGYMLGRNIGYETKRWNLQQRGLNCSEIEELYPPYTTEFGWPTILSQEAIAQTFADMPVQPPTYVDEKEVEQGCFEQYTSAGSNPNIIVDGDEVENGDEVRRGEEEAEEGRGVRSNTKKGGKARRGRGKDQRESASSVLSEVKKGMEAIKQLVYGESSSDGVDVSAWLEQLYTPITSTSTGLDESNNWVVSGNGTASGKPLLANDPHLTLTAPSIWQLVHVECKPCGLDAIGSTFIGAPGVIIGRNSHISWGVTNGRPDIQDLYVMEEGSTPNTYYYKGSDVQYNIESIHIKVKGRSDYVFERKSCVYGPVVTDVLNLEGGYDIALNWTQLQPGHDTTFDSFFQLNLARNWTEFVDALRSFVAPSQNFIYADTEGNIGYYLPGQIPIRKEGHTGRFPVPGNGSFDVEGWIPFHRLPHVLNPPDGYIVTANNKVTPPNYAYRIEMDWGDGYRAERITSMVKGNYGRHTFGTFRTIQLDQVSLPLSKLKPYLSALNVEGAAKQWRDAMVEWDGDTADRSQVATVFQIWYGKLMQMPSSYVGEPGKEWDASEQLYVNMFRHNLTHLCQKWSGQTCEEYAADALRTATNRRTYSSLFGGSGEVIPKWGEEVHLIHFQNVILTATAFGCLGDRSYYGGGDCNTVNVACFNSDFDTYAGPSYRQIIDLNDMEESKFIYPMGQSGDVFSPNYDDYLPIYHAGNYIRMRTSGYTAKTTIVIE